MSMIKTAAMLAVVVALMPTDERRQAELAASAGAALNNTLTYCERNPEPCAKASEGWAQFKRKAEFGFDLASRMVREAMAKRTAVASGSPELAPAADYPRIEPHNYNKRGTLTPADMTSEWRAPMRRTSY